MAYTNQLTFVILLFGLWYFDRPQLVDFGLGRGDIPFVFAFLLGFASYVVLIGLYKYIVRFLGMERRELANSYVVLRCIWPRSERRRRKLLAVLLANPFTEELIYRGFLVFYLGHLFDSILLFSIVGLVVCLTIHLYQGVKMLHFHALFCIASILMLLSPLGLVGCFGFHLAGDIIPFAGMRQALDAWRAQRRLEHHNAA